MFEDTYLTVEGISEGIFKDRGSKFLAFVYNIRNENEIKEKLAQLRKDYHDARHHCYAYVLGFDKSAYRINDDGEPSGTAGKPILGQIKSHNLTNILIVVIRYFGGTLLGVSGLINAYKSASVDALNKAKIIEKTVDEKYSVSFPYSTMNDVMKILKDNKAELLKQVFENECLIEYSIRRGNASIVTNKLQKTEGANVKFLGLSN